MYCGFLHGEYSYVMSKRVVTGIAVAVSLVVVALFFTFFGGQYNIFGEQAERMNPQLVVQDVVVGTGAEAMAGQKLQVHYIGRLQNGQVFDSSRERGQAFTFTLGVGDVIRGWDQGLPGMKVGGKRVLVIPSLLGYGERGIGPIPPDATLIFEVELLGIEQ